MARDNDHNATVAVDPSDASKGAEHPDWNGYEGTGREVDESRKTENVYGTMDEQFESARKGEKARHAKKK